MSLSQAQLEKVKQNDHPSTHACVVRANTSSSSLLADSSEMDNDDKKADIEDTSNDSFFTEDDCKTEGNELVGHDNNNDTVVVSGGGGDMIFFKQHCENVTTDCFTQYISEKVNGGGDKKNDTAVVISQ